MRKLFPLLISLIFLAQLYALNISRDWMIYSEDGAVKLKGDVPCTVKMALKKAKLISDPYFGVQNEDSQWVEDKVWIYERKFFLHKEKGKRYFLKIGGIAPRGEVYLNDNIIAKIEGMFAQPLLEITDLLKDENDLKIRIIPEKDRVKAIACQMSYGWDFAPRIIPIGVWRDIEIIKSGKALLKNPFLKLTKLEGDKALLDLSVDYNSSISGKGKLVLYIEGLNFKGKFKLEKDVDVMKGEGKIAFTFSLPQLRLWYPKGFGEQNLYKVSLHLFIGDSQSSEVSFTWGARTLEWERNPSSKEIYGWIAKVNGVRVYCKGANWVPADSLFDLSYEKYERLVKLASQAGINMFRIWGGGIMEDDKLYELCDKYGIMLWQEFPLACADYPELSLNAFAQNARDSILRLRNHPSLVLWCGGNEFDPDNRSNKPLIDLLEKLCLTLDGTRPFHRASPYGGDVHDWSVWHGSAPYTSYRQFCIFRSEAGLQAPPIEEDLGKFLSTKGLFPPSNEWQYHLADPNKIARYAQSYGSLNDLTDFLKKAHLSQAITYQFNLDSCLKNIWANSGCLIWQFNDPWPNISWSMVDWFGNPKPSFYWFKNASQPINLVVDYDKIQLKQGEVLNIRVYAVNLTPKSAGCKAIFLIASPKRILKRAIKTHTFKAQTAEQLWEINFQVPLGFNENVIFLIARVEKDGKLITDKIYPIPVTKGMGVRKPLKALAIVSSLGREADEWREIANSLEPLGIKLDVVSADSIPPLEGYDCFIIGESEKIGERLGRRNMERIADLVREGRGLLLDGGWFAYLEGGLKGTPIEELSPVIMKANSLRENQSLKIIINDRENPLIRGLNIEGIVIVGYNEEYPKTDSKVLLSLSNGTPLLVERQVGKGKCLAYTSGLRGGWAGALRMWGSYRVFLARLLAYLAGLGEEVEGIQEENKGLDALPEAKLRVEGKRVGDECFISVENISASLSFFINIRVKNLSLQPLFSDNYFHLLPGEKKTIRFSLPSGKQEIVINDWSSEIARLIL
ncbi:hypothetical protein H5T87_04015 [bacterium]|nr:hypothetical protein [bacterium]